MIIISVSLWKFKIDNVCQATNNTRIKKLQFEKKLIVDTIFIGIPVG